MIFKVFYGSNFKVGFSSSQYNIILLAPIFFVMPVNADAIAEEIESIQPKSMFHQRSCNHNFQCHLLRVGLLCTSQLHQAIRRNLVQETNFCTTGCMGGNPLKDSNGSALSRILMGLQPTPAPGF